MTCLISHKKKNFPFWMSFLWSSIFSSDYWGYIFMIYEFWLIFPFLLILLWKMCYHVKLRLLVVKFKEEKNLSGYFLLFHIFLGLKILFLSIIFRKVTRTIFLEYDINILKSIWVSLHIPFSHDDTTHIKHFWL